VRDLRWAVAGLVAVTVSVTGCSEKHEANDTLPSANAAETTEEPAPLGPPDLPMPEEARQQTAEGADAFTKYYVEIYNHALETLDTTYMRDLSSGCDTCDELADQVDQVLSNGEGLEGGQMRIVAATPPYLTGEEAHLVFDTVQEQVSVTQDGTAIEGRTFPQFATSGGGGMLRWDDARTTWLFVQWTWQ
jgi:hypothetical protein